MKTPTSYPAISTYSDISVDYNKNCAKICRAGKTLITLFTGCAHLNFFKKNF
jgi:hypothetical protein